MWTIRKVTCYHRGSSEDSEYKRGPRAGYWSIAKDGRIVDTALSRKVAVRRMKQYITAQAQQSD